MTISHLLVSIWGAIFILSVTANIATAQEKAKSEKAKAEPVQQKAGQTTTKVLLDDEKVRVSETWAKPGEKNEMKARPDRVTYHFDAEKQKIHYSDGKTEVLEFKAGSALYFVRGAHTKPRISGTPKHIILS
jgi:uncharacterized cupredoxin-like copper-binding protein